MCRGNHTGEKGYSSILVICVGGGDRTHDPRLMSPVLYRLSYPDSFLTITQTEALSTYYSFLYTRKMKIATPYTLRDNDLLLTTAPSNANREYVLKIRDLPETDKPREKLLSFGPQKLSTKELLAVVLVNGTTKEDVLSMSGRIVKEYGERSLIAMTDPQRMSKEFNIPLGKAMQIVACGELGRRFFARNQSGLAVIRVAEEAYEYTKDMRDLPREHLRGIFLDTHNRVIHDEIISIGTINSNIVHPREVFKSAIEYNAAAVILVHNHPSGVSAPSLSDIEITKQLIQAGKIVGINLLDHIIVTKDGFTSIEADY